MKKAKNDTVLKLTETSVMIALATVLSVFRIAELPYGGSVTFASMLPIVLIAYRYGAGWGSCAGLLFGVIQQLLGLKNLSYVTGWVSVVAVILLDYLAAFAVIGIAGIFRGKLKNQSAELAVGILLAGGCRYLCHVISGATVWAGLSIPTQAALAYSFGYNATYMIPELLITVPAGFYIASAIDFRARIPAPTYRERAVRPLTAVLCAVVGGVLLIGLSYITCRVFVAAQSPETGLFDFAGFFSRL